MKDWETAYILIGAAVLALLVLGGFLVILQSSRTGPAL